jgi:hypothetical protein
VAGVDADQTVGGNQAFVLADADGVFEVREIRQTVASGNLVIDFNADADADPEMQIFLSGRTTPLVVGDFVL